MIKEFCLAWEKNKPHLEEYFRTHEQNQYQIYQDLVKLLFDMVINPEIPDNTPWTYGDKFDTGSIRVINDGNWQGTLIFILHRNRYNPSIDQYVYTSVEYGSCCGCDTLLCINCEGTCDDLPTDTQVKDYMTLCLHLLQNCVMMKEGEQE